MSGQISGSEIEHLIQLLAKLPGLGPRSARRAALHLIKKKQQILEPLSAAIIAALENIVTCETCGNIDTISPCAICNDARRNPAVLCVVEDVADLWALERAHAHKGRYHVLGGTLSALDGIGPQDLNLGPLIERAQMDECQEVMLATNATVEGQTTAHYITDQLQECGVKISRLAHGVPVGGELDYLDDGTLAAAVNARRPF